MNILVVGGAGYVGSVLTPMLVRGHDVHVVDRCYFGKRSLNIDGWHNVAIGDMREISDEFLDGIDTVIFVSGLSNDPTAEFNPQANLVLNTNAAIRLAQHCIDHGVRRYIYASSASLYDIGEDADAGADVVMDETFPVRPTKPYSVSKHLAEEGLLALQDQMEVVILRKGTLSGWSPRMRYDLVINAMVKDALCYGQIAIHNFGEMWRPICSVRDAARAYQWVAEQPADTVAGQIFNVVAENVRISELGLRVCDILRSHGIEVSISCTDTGRPRNYRVSGEKLTRAGFTPTDGVRNIVEGLLQNMQSLTVAEMEHPRHYNIRWMHLLEEAEQIIGVTGGVW